MADDPEHEGHGGAKTTMDGEESADECEAKLKAFNERADKPSIRNDPKSLVHAIDAFLTTSSTAERWWKKHRSKATFIELWTDCKAAVTAAAGDLNKVKNAERKATDAMLASFMEGAQKAFVTDRKDMQPSNLEELTMVAGGTPRQYLRAIEVSIERACPSKTAFEFLEIVLKGFAADKELQSLMEREKDKLQTTIHQYNRILEGREQAAQDIKDLHKEENDRHAAEIAHQDLFGGVVKAAMSERQCVFAQLARLFIEGGDGAQARYEALESERRTSRGKEKQPPTQEGKGRGKGKPEGDSLKEVTGALTKKLEQCKFGNAEWEEEACDYGPNHEGHIRRNCTRGYSKLKKIWEALKPKPRATAAAATRTAAGEEDTPRTYTKREGDWECTACGFATNFASRATCFRCSKPKGASAAVATPAGDTTAGGGTAATATASKVAELEKELRVARARAEALAAVAAQEPEEEDAPKRGTVKLAMAATALPTLNGQPMPASYQPAVNPPTAEPNATLGTKQSGIKHQETLVSVEVPKLGELSITLRRQADPEGNEEIDVEAIATEVAKALKAERNRSKEGRGVLRFQQDQVAVQLGSEVVAAKKGIYDTGCDILIITCELLSRFAEKTERWVKEKWVQFDLDGVGGINEEAWIIPSTCRAQVLLAPGTSKETAVQATVVVETSRKSRLD
ncbi:hypothetical protein RI054_23g97980 [Pseudoscourfieldia marina]